MTKDTGIDPSVPPSGAGCVECDADGGWWFHLRRCAQCGHIGCCDDSPAKHATAHFRDTGVQGRASAAAAARRAGPDPRWFVHGGVRHRHGDVLDLPVPDLLLRGQPRLLADQAGVEGYTATLAWGSGFFVVGAVIAALLIPNRALEPSEGEPVMAH